MIKFYLTGIASTIAVGAGIAMFLTNPEPKKYKQYAEEALNFQLKEKVCLQISQELGKWLQSQCHTIVDTARPQLAEIVAQQTARQNFILFSIYQTDLPLPSPLPDYHAETIGILGHFYTYYIDR